MREKFNSFINFVTTGQLHLMEQHLWLAGRRSGAVFFARHLDNFIVTRNFTAIYRDWCRLDNFVVTRCLLPSPRTGKKRGTATRTAPN